MIACGCKGTDTAAGLEDYVGCCSSLKGSARGSIYTVTQAISLFGLHSFHGRAWSYDQLHASKFLSVRCLLPYGYLSVKY